MKREIRITEDGSSTLFVPEFGEHYHSVHGAVQESMHVFIEMGLKAIQKDMINLFELGFGTGLNALLTLIKKAKGQHINYYSVEAFPIEEEDYNQLNYSKLLLLDKKQVSCFRQMHHCEWGKLIEITPTFTLRKIQQEIESYKIEQTFDLLYFDAFAPSVQPSLWNETVFRKISEAMNPGGILVTYCAKGEVRRTMKICGLYVERLPGPPGKREMLRAIKPA